VIRSSGQAFQPLPNHSLPAFCPRSSRHSWPPYFTLSTLQSHLSQAKEPKKKLHPHDLPSQRMNLLHKNPNSTTQHHNFTAPLHSALSATFSQNPQRLTSTYRKQNISQNGYVVPPSIRGFSTIYLLFPGRSRNEKAQIEGV
jgi:hypothetical protein